MEQRIIKLERKIIWLYVLFLISLLIVIYGFVKNDPLSANSLQLNKLTLVDASGIKYAEIRKDSNSAGIFIFDENGVERLQMFHSKDGTGFYISDSTENTRLGAAHFSHGGSGFALHGENGKGAAVLYHKGNGALTFYDTLGSIQNQFSFQK